MMTTFEPATPEPVQLESIGDITQLPGVIDRRNPLGHYAGFVTRLVAFLMDQLIVLAMIIIVRAVLDLLENTLPLGTLTSAMLNLVTLAAAFLIHFLYFVLFWVLAGQTPGKKLMGVRIVGANGMRIKPKHAIVRYFGYLVSLPLFLGYLWVLVDARRQAWHDKLARTFVIYSWPEVIKVKRTLTLDGPSIQAQSDYASSPEDVEHTIDSVSTSSL